MVLWMIRDEDGMANKELKKKKTNTNGKKIWY